MTRVSGGLTQCLKSHTAATVQLGVKDDGTWETPLGGASGGASLLSCFPYMHMEMSARLGAVCVRLILEFDRNRN